MEHSNATLFGLWLQEGLAIEIRPTSLHDSLAPRPELDTMSLVSAHPNGRGRVATALEVWPGWELGKEV